MLLIFIYILPQDPSRTTYNITVTSTFVFLQHIGEYLWSYLISMFRLEQANEAFGFTVFRRINDTISQAFVSSCNSFIFDLIFYDTVHNVTHSPKDAFQIFWSVCRISVSSQTDFVDSAGDSHRWGLKQIVLVCECHLVRKLISNVESRNSKTWPWD